MVNSRDISTDLTQWDGSLPSALELRQRVRDLAAVRGGPDSGEAPSGALADALRAYKKRQPERLAPAVAKMPGLAALIGDEAMGRWPFAEVERMADDQAILWLPLVGEAVITPEIVRFVEVLFRVRPRELWIFASRAKARLAIRDAALRLQLTGEWRARFPNGLPKRWPKSGGLVEGAKGNEVHDARHVLHCACAFLALGGSREAVPGLDPGQLVAMGQPVNPADASVVLSGCAELARGQPTRALVLAGLPDLVAGAEAEQQVDAALCELVDALGDEALVAARICEVIEAPRWQRHVGMVRANGLIGWLDQVEWLRNRGDVERAARIVECSAAARPALLLRLERTLPDGAPHAMAAILPRLGGLIDSDLWETAPPDAQTLLVVELLELLELSEIKDLSWRAVVNLAAKGRAIESQPGAVAKVARADLLMWLVARARNAPSVMMRAARLDEPAILVLARCQEGDIARAVAVQAERHLRDIKPDRPEIGPGSAQVRFLWRLLQSNPPARAVQELADDLRGKDTPLHATVLAVAELDRLRDCKNPPTPDAEIVAQYDGVIAAAKPLLESDDLPARLLGELRQKLTIGDRGEAGSETWLVWFRTLLYGANKTSGIQAWTTWLGLGSDEFAATWEKLDAALGRLNDTAPAAEAADCNEVENLTRQLEQQLESLTWPEARVIKNECGRLHKRLADDRDRARRAAEASTWLRALLVGACEPEIEGLTGDDPTAVQRRELLAPGELRAAGHFLLQHLLFKSADRLRLQIAGRVQLPSPRTYLSPLYLGVASGVFTVMDVGTNWNQVVWTGTWTKVYANPHWLEYWSVTLLAWALSFVLLAVKLGGRMRTRTTGDESRLGRWQTIGRRVSGPFAQLAGIAVTVSGVVLATLQGTDACTGKSGALYPPTQLLLWSGLSLFLGLFIGLIAQNLAFDSHET